MTESNKCPAGMVLIPHSKFMMGSPDGVFTSGDETPRHEVEVSAFCFDKYEFTNGDKGRVKIASARNFELSVVACGSGATSIVARGSDARKLWQDHAGEIDFEGTCGLQVKPVEAFEWPQSPDGFDGPNQPLVNVSWKQADAICRAQGKRLPTEAEWEKAAIGPTKGYDTRVQYGTRSGQLSKAEAVYNTGKTANVGTKPPNGHGLYDVTGNVWEWVADWYNEKYYENSPATDPKGPENGDYKVLRGGSWSYIFPGDLRVANRGVGHPNYRYDFIGFRCASAPQDSKK